MCHPPIIAVCGVKNSGKTTFLSGLLPLLRAQGLRVAVIKHDGHDFEPDVPGTDSHCLRAAGAEGVAVFSAHRYALTEARPGLTPEALAALFPDYDLVLLEGGKHTTYPKLEVVRGAVSAAPVSNPAGLLALVTDVAGLCCGQAPTLGLADYEAACALITGHLKGLQ
ncbi:molybdopterin-guanine dinucleotide biosynthesis protein B [Ruminococcaceae bacterium OttesenSCG-928-A11]|nr:molybdopterin-guanine dinucleotide biosynthesis protein B [Ruminococcaceae bacterium OttesenSCG-928-A11]